MTSPSGRPTAFLFDTNSLSSIARVYRMEVLRGVPFYTVSIIFNEFTPTRTDHFRPDTKAALLSGVMTRAIHFRLDEGKNESEVRRIQLGMANQLPRNFKGDTIELAAQRMNSEQLKKNMGEAALFVVAARLGMVIVTDDRRATAYAPEYAAYRERPIEVIDTWKFLQNLGRSTDRPDECWGIIEAIRNAGDGSKIIRTGTREQFFGPISGPEIAITVKDTSASLC